MRDWQKAEASLKELAKDDLRFDPETSICLVVAEMNGLADSNSKASPMNLLIRYNTSDQAVSAAEARGQLYLGLVDFHSIKAFFREKESREYPYRVIASILVRECSPSPTEIMEPAYYLIPQNKNVRDCIKRFTS